MILLLFWMYLIYHHLIWIPYPHNQNSSILFHGTVHPQWCCTFWCNIWTQRTQLCSSLLSPARSGHAPLLGVRLVLPRWTSTLTMSLISVWSPPRATCPVPLIFPRKGKTYKPQTVATSESYMVCLKNEATIPSSPAVILFFSLNKSILWETHSRSIWPRMG